MAYPLQRIGMEIFRLESMCNPIKSFRVLLCTLCFAVFIHVSVYGQFGARAQYVTGQIEAYLNNSQKLNGNGYDISVNYWTRLRNLRIEFFPEINYGMVAVTSTELSAPGDVVRYGLAVPVSIYPFDLKGDCKCPTFSKQNELFKKGFFFQVVPAFQRFQISFNSGSKSDWKEQVNAGVGIGLDIGLSDLVTISPLLHYFTSIYTSGAPVEKGITQDLRVGARALFRLDYP
jgi:hypothetical protein